MLEGTFELVSNARRMLQLTAHLPQLQAAAERHVTTLLELEPRNPRSHILAGEVADTLRLRPGRNIEHMLRAHQLAVEQRSDYYAARSAYEAIIVAGTDMNLALSQAMLEAALAAAEQAQAALQRCKSMLPESWVCIVETGLRQSAPMMVQNVQAALAYHQHMASAASLEDLQQAEALREAATSMAARTMMHPPADTNLLLCAGCQQQAVGLRKCSICGRALYCRCGFRDGCCMQPRGVPVHLLNPPCATAAC